MLEAAAVGVPHEVKGETIVVFVRLRPGETDEPDLRRAISDKVVEQLGKALRPEAIHVVTDLPRTRSGKIMRRVARAAYLGIDPGDLSALDNPLRSRTDPSREVAMTDFRVLGPIEALKGGQPVALGGARQRTLLALLLLRYGRAVPVAELIDSIWAGDPPERAATILRSYVSRLRSALGESAPVSEEAFGYAINVGPESVDAALFEHLVRAADTDLARGHPAAAADQLEHALSLWRGRAFGYLSDDEPFRREAERLDSCDWMRSNAVSRRCCSSAMGPQSPTN